MKKSETPKKVTEISTMPEEEGRKTLPPGQEMIEDMRIKNAEMLLLDVSRLPRFFSRLATMKRSGGEYDEDPRAFGPNYDVLGVMRRASRPVPMSIVARNTGLSKQHLTMIVDNLSEFGFVKRVPDEEDRRVVNLEMTKEGLEFLLRGKRRSVAIIQSVLADLTDDEVVCLSKALAILHREIVKLEELDA